MKITEILQFYKDEMKKIGHLRPLSYFSDIWRCRIYYYNMFEDVIKNLDICWEFVGKFEKVYNLRVIQNECFGKNVHLWGYNGNVLSCVLRVEHVNCGVCLKIVAIDKTDYSSTLKNVIEGYYIKKHDIVFVEIDDELIKHLDVLKKLCGGILTIIDIQGNEHVTEDFEKLFWASPIDFMNSYIKISKK